MDVLSKQFEALQEHKSTISSIKGRRDKFFAHMDEKYLHDPEKIYDDFPLEREDVIMLARTLLYIVHEHERGLNPKKTSFHLAEFFEISLDNMVRNLETGRRINFPDQEI